VSNVSSQELTTEQGSSSEAFLAFGGGLAQDGKDVWRSDAVIERLCVSNGELATGEIRQDG